MKTVKDLFILEGMKDSTVLAGHQGLTRPVRFVNISDTPDVIKILNKDDLLLTTAYPFQNQTPKLRRLIEQMNALRCAGIVIRIDRFLKELPLEVKRVADQLSFPVINLPPQYTLGEVSHYILNYLNNDKAEKLYYALHVHNKFSEMMFKGYDLPSLVEQLGQFLKRPVLLLNHRGEKIAGHHDFRKTSMQYIEREVIEKAQKDIVAARKGTTFEIASESYRTVTTFPVKTQHRYPSVLLIFDAKSLPYPASQMAIEQACHVISFTLIKEQAIEENSRLFKNNFFADLIEERIHSAQEIVNRSEHYGLKANMKTVCIVCHIDEDENEGTLHENQRRELHNSIYEHLEDALVSSRLQGTLFIRERYIVLLIQFPHYTEKEMKSVQSFLEDVQNQLEGHIPVSFGVSNQIQALQNVSTAYEEAVEALKSGYDLNMSGFIKFYRTREIKELLGMIPRKFLSEFYENTLKSLAYSQTKEDLELVKTIQVYLDSQCEISETSRKLYVHRNTVKYRIEKAEALLNRDLRDPSDSLRIRVALLIGSFIQD